MSLSFKIGFKFLRLLQFSPGKNISVISLLHKGAQEIPNEHCLNFFRTTNTFFFWQTGARDGMLPVDGGHTPSS